MHNDEATRAAYDIAHRTLGSPLNIPVDKSEPSNAQDFLDLATKHTFGDSWSRTGLNVQTRAMISVAIVATLGAHDPLRGQLRIALRNGVAKEEIVELFIHLEAYAGAARAFEGYQIAKSVFAE